MAVTTGGSDRTTLPLALPRRTSQLSSLPAMSPSRRQQRGQATRRGRVGADPDEAEQQVGDVHAGEEAPPLEDDQTCDDHDQAPGEVPKGVERPKHGAEQHSAGQPIEEDADREWVVGAPRSYKNDAGISVPMVAMPGVDSHGRKAAPTMSTIATREVLDGARQVVIGPGVAPR